MTTTHIQTTRVRVRRAKVLHSAADLAALPYLDVREVAHMLRITQDTVYRCVKTGELVAENYGSGRRPVYRISADALRAWRVSRAVVPYADPGHK